MPIKQLNEIVRYDYSEILGWSVSRYDKFNLCRRQYYYDYYGKYDTEFPRYKINALKSMTSVALEIGNIVHDTIKAYLERLLKSEEPIKRERFLDYAKNMTVEYCGSKTFTETYYKQFSVIDSGKIYEGVKAGLINFLGSERCGWITEKAITNKSGWVIEPPGFGETRIGGLKAYCKVDFLFPVEGDLHIMDWKTGRPDEKKHSRQLTGYSAWASNNFGAEPSRIHPVTAYLVPAYSEMKVSVAQEDIDGFVTAVKNETFEMYSMLTDIERNIPKNKQEFSKTTNSKICNYCNYREICLGAGSAPAF